MPQRIEVSKGRQGRHTFFVGTMTWGELDQMLVFPDDPALTRIDDEDKRMQRDLQKDRIAALTEYLVEAEDHFFSALCLVILPRDLSRPACAATEESVQWDYLFTATKEKALPGAARRGILDISGSAKLFTADGQHRGRSGKEALIQRAELADEDVPVVIVPYESPDQVRQLFADLNLNATKPDKTLALEFDSRDPIVRLAKQATADIDLFRGRVNRISRSLAPTSQHVITLKSLVDGTREIASALAGLEGGGGKKKKEARAAQLKEFVKREDAVAEVRAAWETIIHAFEEKWDTVMEGKPSQELRDAYVFPHGLGWEALAHAASQLISQRKNDWAPVFQKACRSIDWRRTNREVWQNVAVIYDDTKKTDDPKKATRVNNTVSGIRATAGVILKAAGAKDMSPVEAEDPPTAADA